MSATQCVDKNNECWFLKCGLGEVCQRYMTHVDGQIYETW